MTFHQLHNALIASLPQGTTFAELPQYLPLEGAKRILYTLPSDVKITVYLDSFAVNGKSYSLTGDIAERVNKVIEVVAQ